LTFIKVRDIFAILKNYGMKLTGAYKFEDQNTYLLVEDIVANDEFRWLHPNYKLTFKLRKHVKLFLKTEHYTIKL